MTRHYNVVGQLVQQVEKDNRGELLVSLTRGEYSQGTETS